MGYSTCICCTNCHVHTLFINGHKLATRNHICKLDIVAPRFEYFANMESLAWRVVQLGNSSTYTSINFRLPWAGSILPIR